MTEEEAKTKWCPQMREELLERHLSDPERLMNRCIGSACMAWRWAGWVNRLADGSHEVNQTHGGPFLMPHGPTQNPHGCDRFGYCGLAGKP